MGDDIENTAHHFQETCQQTDENSMTAIKNTKYFMQKYLAILTFPFNNLWQKHDMLTCYGYPVLGTEKTTGLLRLRWIITKSLN